MALLRLGRFPEAEKVFARVLALAPADDAALAGLGKIALFRDDAAAAESLLAGPARAGDDEARPRPATPPVRLGRWSEAADLSEAAGQPGRADAAAPLAERGAYQITAGPERASRSFARTWPTPLVNVKLNGQMVLMAVDTGADDLILDDSAARVAGIAVSGTQHLVFWNGSRVAVTQRLGAAPRARRLPDREPAGRRSPRCASRASR